MIQEEVVPFDELYVTHKGLEMLCVLLESTSIKSMNGTLQVWATWLYFSNEFCELSEGQIMRALLN